MQQRHKDRSQYFKEQGLTTEKYVIPYVSSFVDFTSNTRVLEVGCGEGGNMMPFVEKGCDVVGVDISASQIKKAAAFFQEKACKNVHVLAKDIYETTQEEIGTFDFIFLRDVIEHIPNQEQFFEKVKVFLKDDGVIFFGFPPWRMPFGGHQQICSSKLLSLVPYIHLLPYSLYSFTLKLFGESKETIESLLEIKDTGISISRFFRCVQKSRFEVLRSTHWLINPNYETKFGLRQRILWPIFKIPKLKDFYTTAIYCVIRKRH